MRILVVGAGAIGSVLGGFLAVPAGLEAPANAPIADLVHTEERFVGSPQSKDHGPP